MQSQSTSPDFYRPELDVLRSVAFFMVFVHHAFDGVDVSWVAAITQACGIGVQIFFFLSAYLIMELLLREREKTGTVHVQAFYIRRVLRIWPLYFFFLAFTLLLARVAHFGTFPWPLLAACLLLSGNWWVHLHGWMPNVASPLWSISIEEQFYVTWPLLVRSATRRTIRCISWLVLAGALISAVEAGRNLPAYRHSFWSNSLTEFAFFAAGSLAAFYYHEGVVRISWSERLTWLFAGILAAGVACRYFHLDDDIVVRRWDLPIAFLLLTCAIGMLFRTFLGVTVPTFASPLVRLGKISYGMYVFHYGALSLCVKVLYHKHLGQVVGIKSATQLAISSFLLTLALAVVSYHLLELPFLRLKRRFTFVKTRSE